MSGPLKGVRVLDLTAVVSGPYATMFLADQGADVLKIEPIGGDSARRSRAAIDKAGEFSALFISSNRGKRSLSIDVKSDAGREVLAKQRRICGLPRTSSPPILMPNSTSLSVSGLPPAPASCVMKFLHVRDCPVVNDELTTLRCDKLMMLALKGFERACAWSEDQGVGHSRVNTPVPKLSPH
jgi:hypothetical protein